MPNKKQLKKNMKNIYYRAKKNQIYKTNKTSSKQIIHTYTNFFIKEKLKKTKHTRETISL